MAWFGKKKKADEATAAAPLSAVDEANEARASERLSLYERFGQVQDYVLAPIISSHLMGQAPEWPSREAHRVIETTDGMLMFVTDGLTDTFADGTEGLGYEIAMKVPAPATGTPALESAMQSPYFPLHQEFAFNALTWPDLRPMLQEQGALSMILPAGSHATAFRAEDPQGALVGSLIGPATLTTAADPVMVVPITLILPEELSALERGGPETRPALAQALVDANIGWASNPDRPPVSF